VLGRMRVRVFVYMKIPHALFVLTPFSFSLSYVLLTDAMLRQTHCEYAYVGETEGALLHRLKIHTHVCCRVGRRYARTHTHLYMYICLYIFNLYLHLCLDPCVCIHSHIFIYTYTYSYMYIYIPTRMYTCTRIYAYTWHIRNTAAQTRASQST